MARPGDEAYKARLGAVLRQRDPVALHLFLRQSASGYGDQEQVSAVEERSYEQMLELLHRMTLARPDLADLHAESRAWLTQRGLLAPPSAGASDARTRRARRGQPPRTRPPGRGGLPDRRNGASPDGQS